MIRYLKLKEVMKLTSLSKSTIYDYIQRGLFPAQVLIGKRRVGWPEHLIFEWLLKKAQGIDLNRIVS